MVSSKASTTYSKATAATSRTGKTCLSTATRPEKPDLLECFRDPKVCEIPATSGQPKPDIFEVLRPKPKTVLGYNISQTDIKGQRQEPTGITKLHIQQTSAKYELPPPGFAFSAEKLPTPPPPEPKFQYSTGRGPVWEFLDDIWRRKLEKKQAAYQKNLARLIVQRKKTEKEQTAKAHAKLMKLVGPDWFQELSPNQLRTIDNLKNCIVKDVKSKSTCNTQANIAELGLVLRPNSRHIKIALKKCCECPVEFLLILYQLLNRHRTEYSLNDRLLLSGVVHLTMRETLKELHIRIPSPPPIRKPKTPKKKEKKKHYKSPYLVPFTFVPAPPKHTGIYKNNHIQYPESPYFSYISELKTEISEAIAEDEDEGEGEKKTSKSKKKKQKNKVEKQEGQEDKEEGEEEVTKIMATKRQSGITDAQEKELIDELRVAQREYNKLGDHDSVPFLHKPSIYIPCDHGLKRKKEQEIEGEKEEEGEDDDVSSENETNATVSVEVRVTTDFDECYHPIRKVCECRITFDETKVPRHRNVEDEDEDEEGEAQAKDDDREVVKTLSQPSGVAAKKTQIETKTVAVSTFSTDSVRNQFEEKQKVAEKSITAEKEKTEIVSNADSKAKPLEPPVNTDENLVTLGQRESSECKCMEEAQKIIETKLCQCDRCKADRAAAEQSKKTPSIISGVQEVQLENEEEVTENEVVPEISGVKAKEICDCLEKFQAKVKMYEEMKKRFDAQHNLKTLKQKYIIGGVAHSPDGEPVYMLSGVIPHHECLCAQIIQEQLEEEKRLANMPKIPLGRQKYVISGVRETEQGNVFIVSEAAGIEDCACMKMYKSYANKHEQCLKIYQDYLKKVEMDTQEYMEELATDSRFGDIELPQSASKDEDEIADEAEDVALESIEPSKESQQRISVHSAELQNIGKIISGGFKASTDAPKKKSETETTGGQKQSTTEKVPSQTKEVCQCWVIDKPPTKEICQCGVIDNEEDWEDLVTETELNLTLEVNKDRKGKNNKEKEKSVCICEPDYSVSVCKKFDPSECQCGVDSSSSEETNSVESVEPLLRRFTIMDKIPCNLRKQLEIVKQALEVLAEDGFPLAKLPDSYKLPHFKLWMQLRCGKFWTQEERGPMLMQSFGHWKHATFCNRKTKLPTLDMTPAQAAQYTWGQANFIKRMTTEKDLLYYRKVRQANIGDGREFFPSTFSYELPTPNFRDCYFAYVSAKEEECNCWRPWYIHEVKNFDRRKSCL